MIKKMIMQLQGYIGEWSWHSANDIESEGCVFIIYICLLHLFHFTFLSGVWRQWDGTLLSFTPFWYQHVRAEPGGGSAENCGGVGWGVKSDPTMSAAGQWWANACSREHHYVCEKGIWIKTMKRLIILIANKISNFTYRNPLFVFISLPIDKSGLIGTEGALRLPTTYDNHPIPSHPIPSTYSCEDDLSIEDLI